MVDDSEADALLLLEEIRQAGYAPVHERVDTASAMAAALGRQPWDVILSDHSMPAFDSMGALAAMHDKGLDLPFIVVSGMIGEETTAALMKAGAHDVILKGHSARLAPAIERELREARLRQDRRRMEKDLKKSEQRLTLAMTAARLDLWEWDVRKNTVRWHGISFNCWNQPGRDFNGRLEDMLDKICSEDRGSVREAILAAVEDSGDGGYFDIEMRIPCPGGGVRWVHTKNQVLAGPDGQPGRIVGIGMDITERKRTEEALRAAEERFEKVFQHSPVLIMISTLPEGRIVDVNKAFAHNLGYAREEVLGQLEEDLGIWDDARARGDILCRLREENSVNNFEAFLLRKSGSSLAGLCSGATIEVDGKSCLLLSVTDISERKWAEEALRESEQRFRMLAINSPDAIFMQDRELRYICVYNTPADLLTPEKMLGKTDLEIFGAVQGGEMRRCKLEVLQTGKSMRTERVITLRGRDHVFECSYEPRFGAGNQTIGVTVYAREITERKNVEAQLVQHRDRLEDLVAERTSELTAANARMHSEIEANQRAQLALRQSETLYRQLVETSPDAITLIDPSAKILMVNAKSVLLTESGGQEELVGHSFYDFIAAEDHARVTEAFGKVFKTGFSEFEITALKKGGSRFFIEIRAASLSGKNEAPSGALIVMRPIAELKRLEMV
jgi:PAS domain S-box-containing protein